MIYMQRKLVGYIMQNIYMERRPKNSISEYKCMLYQEIPFIGLRGRSGPAGGAENFGFLVIQQFFLNFLTVVYCTCARSHDYCNVAS